VKSKSRNARPTGPSPSSRRELREVPEDAPPDVTFQQAYPFALRAARAHASSKLLSAAAADREDAQQEGLLACWRAWSHFDPNRGSLPTFFDRVITNHLISLWRSARRNRFLPIDADCVADSGVGEIELRCDLRSALQRLRASDRGLALSLIDCSPAEAARRLRISRSTVYVRMSEMREIFVAIGIGRAAESYVDAGRQR